MAKINDNLLLRGVSGRIGTVIVKQYSYGGVLSALPRKTKKKPTKESKNNRNNFAFAVAYAQHIIADPKRKADYARKHNVAGSVYHAALSEYRKREK